MSLGLPIKLSEIGIGSDRFEEMASKATAGDTKTLGNFVEMKKDDIVKIYQLAE